MNVLRRSVPWLVLFLAQSPALALSPKQKLQVEEANKDPRAASAKEQFKKFCQADAPAVVVDHEAFAAAEQKAKDAGDLAPEFEAYKNGYAVKWSTDYAHDLVMGLAGFCESIGASADERKVLRAAVQRIKKISVKFDPTFFKVLKHFQDNNEIPKGDEGKKLFGNKGNWTGEPTWTFEKDTLTSSMFFRANVDERFHEFLSGPFLEK